MGVGEEKGVPDMQKKDGERIPKSLPGGTPLPPPTKGIKNQWIATRFGKTMQRERFGQLKLEI